MGLRTAKLAVMDCKAGDRVLLYDLNRKLNEQVWTIVARENVYALLYSELGPAWCAVLELQCGEERKRVVAAPGDALELLVGGAE